MTTDSHSKYKRFGENGEVVSVLILKGHLVIEELLTMIIKATFKNEKEIMEARLSFRQKCLLAKAGSGHNKSDGIWKIIDTVNKLRNDIAHNLAPNKSTDLIEKLKTQLEVRDIEAYKLIPDVNDGSQIVSHSISFCIGFLEAYSKDKTYNEYIN